MIATDVERPLHLPRMDGAAVRARQQDVCLLLNVYGITVSVSSDDATIAEHLGEDFAYFFVASLAAAPDLSLTLHCSPPPYDCVPGLAATVYTPRNVSFHHSGKTYIDYSGRALGILDIATGHLDVHSIDPDLLYEVAYLFLLAQIGEQLDRRHLHRIHAVAISVQEKAALVLLPMGGGKSTLATHLLADPRVHFLSDDSPIVDRAGGLHAFPLRIGILPGSESGFDPLQLRTIQRMEFGPKMLLRHAFFADRIVPDAHPAFLFLGRRSLSDDCVVLPASRLAALRALIPNCVIGLGLFQGMEFVFNRDLQEIGRKAVVAFSRLRNCVALVRRSSSYTVVLGRDLRKNADTLLAFMETAEKVGASPSPNQL
jgi:hypothetical protein